ncbi:MAG: MBL fold metallo-hydrolase [Candidatus Latescibacterota bacterium]
MKITFWGAAKTVTGSMHLVEANGSKILLDCGLYQGRREESRKLNSELPFNQKEIDALILSHAHIDHSGNIPSLVKNGFDRTIYSTHATRDLCTAMLADSAHIHEKEAEYMNLKMKRNGERAVFQPLYTMKDALDAVELFHSVNYGKRINVADGVDVVFHDAGHILGSSLVELFIKENGKEKKLVYTGDVGRKNLPILRDPEYIAETDVLITESTYGNRVHDNVINTNEKLKHVIIDTYSRGGKIIVPAFSVGRTQELVYAIHQLVNEKAIPDLPVYVDSPLSVNVTQIFRMHPECFDIETLNYLYEGEDPFGFRRMTYIRTVEESKQLNTSKVPCIIISSSGMCEVGRILHHLKNNVENVNNTILIAGFMADNTLGKHIVDREPRIRIFGDFYSLRAKVVIMNEFSAHADKNELIEWTSGFQKKPSLTCVVHGNEDAALAHKSHLEELGLGNVVVPGRGDNVSF